MYVCGTCVYVYQRERFDVCVFVQSDVVIAMVKSIY